MNMKPEIIDVIRDRREREAAGDRDPWTWRDIARLCWAGTANNLNHEIIEGFAEGDNWRVQHGLLAWDNIEDPELREYVKQTDWLLPDPSDSESEVTA